MQKFFDFLTYLCHWLRECVLVLSVLPLAYDLVEFKIIVITLFILHVMF